MARATRSIVHFEAVEQTLCLRVVSGPVDKKVFLISRNSLSRTVGATGTAVPVLVGGPFVAPNVIGEHRGSPYALLNLVVHMYAEYGSIR